MSRKDAMAWVVSVCAGSLRKSQVTTLAVLVAGAMGAMRLSLAGVGREVAAADDGSAKHAIKRAWRFLANPRVEPAEVMPMVMHRLLRRRLKWHAKRPDRRPVRVSLDWTKVRRFHVLMAGIVVDGRALPLCWESYADRVRGKSQNALEQAMLLRVLAALEGTGVRVVVLADRPRSRLRRSVVDRVLPAAGAGLPDPHPGEGAREDQALVGAVGLLPGEARHVSGLYGRRVPKRPGDADEPDRAVEAGPAAEEGPTVVPRHQPAAGEQGP
jgi:hypothetical protein